VDFKDKIVLVTGGANGIGRALCEQFANAGAKVAVVDLEGDVAIALAAPLGGIGLAADVGLEADIQSVVLETESRLGPIDIFVSNAGVSFSDGPGWMAASARRPMKPGRLAGMSMLWRMFSRLVRLCRV